MHVSEALIPVKFLMVLICFLISPGIAAPNIRIADITEVESFFETRKVKVAYQDNDFKLFYIDFSEDIPTKHLLVDSPEVSNPAFSPDGNWIAYQTGALTDGKNIVPATSWIIETREDAVPIQISATDSGWTPRFLQGADELTVVWATCGGHPTPNTYAWEGCGAMLKRTCTGGVLGPVDTLLSGGTYFGGSSYDGLYVSTAEYKKNAFIKQVGSPGPPADIHNITCTGQNGADTTFALQTCNPSSSQSRKYQNVMMFLDFGFWPEDDSLSNCDLNTGSWGFHQILFIANDKNEILKKFRMYPPGPSADTGIATSFEWTLSEWSTHPYFGVSSVFVTRKWQHELGFLEPSKEIEHIVAIDLKDSAYLHLVSSTDTTNGNHIGMTFGALYVEVPPGGFREECWLGPDTCVDVNTEKPQRMSSITSKISVSGKCIVSSIPMSEVKLYRLNGTMLSSYLRINSTSLFINSLEWGSGFLIISVLLTDGTSTLVPVHSLINML